MDQPAPEDSVLPTDLQCPPETTTNIVAEDVPDEIASLKSDSTEEPKVLGHNQGDLQSTLTEECETENTPEEGPSNVAEDTVITEVGEDKAEKTPESTEIEATETVSDTVENQPDILVVPEKSEDKSEPANHVEEAESIPTKPSITETDESQKDVEDASMAVDEKPVDEKQADEGEAMDVKETNNIDKKVDSAVLANASSEKNTDECEKMETDATDGIEMVVEEDPLSFAAILQESTSKDTLTSKTPEKPEDSIKTAEKEAGAEKTIKDFVVLVDLENAGQDKPAASVSKSSEKEKVDGGDVIMIDLDSDEEEKRSPAVAAKKVAVVKTGKTPEKQVIQRSPKPTNPTKQVTPVRIVASSKTTTPTGKAVSPQKQLTPVKIIAKTIESPASGGGLKRKLDVEQAKTTPPKSVEVKECVNFECKKLTKEYLKAPAFILNFFRIPKKLNKVQHVCLECFDDAVLQYEELCGALEDWQPLLIQDLPVRDDLVEISDSSDDEEGDGKPISDDEAPLDQEALDLVEGELDDILVATLERVRISNQVSWAKSMLETRTKMNEEVSLDILDELRELQRKADKMYKKLYSTSDPIYEEQPPLDINHTVEISTISIPPLGELKAPSVVKGATFFGVRHRLLAAWCVCSVVESDVSGDGSKMCKVMFKGGNRSHVTKTLPWKHLASMDPPRVRLTIGTRVIALFNLQRANNLKQQTKNSFFPGIIAEPIQMTNQYRYLVFFDDGYAQYVRHEDVRVVCESSPNVWDDVHVHSREFMANYLKTYRNERPMVQVKKGQKMITEYKGKWTFAKVTEIDTSLIQVHFEQDNRYEWIYRGSARLGPLYRENKAKHAGASVTQLQKRNEPSVEYITIVDDDEKPGEHTTRESSKPTEKAVDQPAKEAEESSDTQATTPQAAANRAVAKKSTSSRPLQANSASAQPPQPAVKHMNTNTIIIAEDEKLIGKVVYYRARKNLPPNKFKPHNCTPDCLFVIKHNLNSYSPLAKPLLSGFERQLCKNKTKKTVMYRAPCGRRLRNMVELHRYLRLTKCLLNVDNFDFDILIHCLAEYVIESAYVNIRDISDGKETMPIPCVNYFDDTQPPPCIYSTKRIPTENVALNLDKDFLVGCDCKDDCSDKTKCSCWRLTIDGATYGNPHIDRDLIGYSNKRLPDAVITGIYECNPRCRCKSNCLNRVVQHPIQVKLQAFKTTNRGWGLRCLNDIPKGSFICCYAGHLLSEETANKICQEGGDHGDEYFAELDYIEVVERFKEGYESDAYESSEVESEDYEPEGDKHEDSDDDFRTPIRNSTDSMAVRTRSQVKTDIKDDKPKSAKAPSKGKPGRPPKAAAASAVEVADEKTGDEPVISISDDEELREPVNLMPNPEMLAKDEVPVTKHRSVRRMFGKGEHVYIMDAKKSGNIGRYFNHSCNPNLFVQNVFVDTHDLRFPWVAFFASSHIRSGTELTWNYNYDVGSVPGKVLYCQCGAANCRQRLL